MAIDFENVAVTCHFSRTPEKNTIGNKGACRRQVYAMTTARQRPGLKQAAPISAALEKAANRHFGWDHSNSVVLNYNANPRMKKFTLRAILFGSDAQHQSQCSGQQSGRGGEGGRGTISDVPLSAAERKNHKSLLEATHKAFYLQLE